MEGSLSLIRSHRTARHTRPIKAGTIAWAQKNIARNDGLQWQSRSYHAIMHQVHTTWGKLPSGSFQLVLVMHTCTDLFYLC